MKRFIVLLLSAYIVLIACYPCSDQDTCVDETKSIAEVSIAGDERSPDASDLCSPFCICSCCSTHINQPKYFQFAIYIGALVEPVSHIKPHSIKSVPSTIWQPPKIA